MSEPVTSRDWLSWRALSIGAAVAVCVGVIGSYFWREPAAVAVLRGGERPGPTLVVPKDETLSPREVRFEWKASGAVRLIVVDLSASAQVVVDRVTSDDTYQPSGDERRAFVAGHEYHWYVETQDRGRRGQSSEAARFKVR